MLASWWKHFKANLATQKWHLGVADANRFQAPSMSGAEPALAPLHGLQC